MFFTFFLRRVKFLYGSVLIFEALHMFCNVHQTCFIASFIYGLLTFCDTNFFSFNPIYAVLRSQILFFIIRISIRNSMKKILKLIFIIFILNLLKINAV